MNNLSNRFLTENFSWHKKCRDNKYVNKKWINKSVFHLPTTCCLFIYLSPHNFSGTMSSRWNTITVLGHFLLLWWIFVLPFSSFGKSWALSPVLFPLWLQHSLKYLWACSCLALWIKFPPPLPTPAIASFHAAPWLSFIILLRHTKRNQEAREIIAFGVKLIAYSIWAHCGNGKKHW